MYLSFTSPIYSQDQQKQVLLQACRRVCREKYNDECRIEATFQSYSKQLLYEAKTLAPGEPNATRQNAVLCVLYVFCARCREVSIPTHPITHPLTPNCFHAQSVMISMA